MIEGKIIKFRSLESNDLIKLKEWRNKTEVRKTTREYRLLNMVNQKKWLEKIQLENPPSSIMFGVLNKKNNLIGVCGLTYIDWKNKHAEISLTYVYGIGKTRAKNICLKLGINPEKNISDLSEDQIESIRTEVSSFIVEGDLRREVATNIKRLQD